MHHPSTLKPILIDVDDTVGDLMSRVLEIINKKFGTAYVKDDIKLDFRRSIKEWNKECEDALNAPGFVESISPLPGTQAAVKGLREAGYKILFVTSPYRTSPTWTWERMNWLRDHFDTPREEIVFAKDKRYVDGLTLIDDYNVNCNAWSEYWNKTSLLVKQPWNEKDLNTLHPLVWPVHNTFGPVLMALLKTYKDK